MTTPANLRDQDKVMVADQPNQRRVKCGSASMDHEMAIAIKYREDDLQLFFERSFSFVVIVVSRSFSPM